MPPVTPPPERTMPPNTDITASCLSMPDPQRATIITLTGIIPRPARIRKIPSLLIRWPWVSVQSSPVTDPLLPPPSHRVLRQAGSPRRRPRLPWEQARPNRSYWKLARAAEQGPDYTLDSFKMAADYRGLLFFHVSALNSTSPWSSRKLNMTKPDSARSIICDVAGLHRATSSPQSPRAPLPTAKDRTRRRCVEGTRPNAYRIPQNTPNNKNAMATKGSNQVNRPSANISP
jgi:hypothetical protein